MRLITEACTSDRGDLPPGSAIVSNRRQGNGFVIRNCTHGHNVGHGALIRASDGLIESNLIERVTYHGIEISYGYNWLEGGCSRNVTVRGNVLRDNGIGGKTWGGFTGPTGVECKACSCPRQPGFLAYMREMALVYAAFKPAWIWIDDDLRIDNHGPCDRVGQHRLLVPHVSFGVQRRNGRQVDTRAFASRTAQGMLVESIASLAYGMNAVSMLVMDTRSETDEWYAENLLAPMSAEREVLKGYADWNRDTVPAGLADESGAPVEELYDYALTGVPVVPGVGKTFGAITAKDVNINISCQSSKSLCDLRRRADERAGGRLPVLVRDPSIALVVPRVTKDGRLKSVMMLNARIDVQKPVTLVLRGVPEDVTSATWRAFRNPPVCFGPRVAAEVAAGRLVMSLGEVPTAVPKETPDRDRLINEELKKKGQTLFAKDGVHPALPGHEFYLKSVVAAFEAMRELPPCDHAPFVGRPFFDGTLAEAKMVPVSPSMMLGEGWTKLAADEPEQKAFAKRGGQFWRADRPGAKLAFRFRGTKCGVYDLLAPKGANVRITVDGKVTRESCPCFDAWCWYTRLAPLWVFDGAEGEHSVEIEVLEKQPDRSQGKREPVNTSKYDGTWFQPCQIMVVGDVVSHEKNSKRGKKQ